MKPIVELFREFAGQAEEEFGLEEKAFSIGGCDVRLRFAGSRWTRPLTSALKHLQAAEPVAQVRELTVSILDGSMVPRNPLLRSYLKPLVDFWPDYTGPRGELLHLHVGSTMAFYTPGPDHLSIVDLESNLGFFWKRDLSPLPYYEAGSPLRTLLHPWLREQGVQFVHGAAVGTESGGVLMAGKGGSGKSTSALACLHSDLMYAGDDYCLVGCAKGDTRRLYSLYNTAKLVGDNDLAKFNGLASHVWNPQRERDEKVTIFLAESFPQQLISHFPLRAILVPVIRGGRVTVIEPCPRGEALMALGPSTLAQLPASGGKDLESMARLVRSLPCFRMNLGTDLSRIAPAISGLLNHLI
jgi:hypothetical protein